MTPLSQSESSAHLSNSADFRLSLSQTKKKEMEMPEAELREHYWSGQEMTIDSFLAYITILSGYLVVAFIVGERLSKLQALIITFGFIIFTSFTTWGAVTFWNAAYVTGVKLASTHLEVIPVAWLNPALVAFVCMIGGQIAGCKFIWDIRHPKTEG
jgi:hypothetical protein